MTTITATNCKPKCVKLLCPIRQERSSCYLHETKAPHHIDGTEIGSGCEVPKQEEEKK